MPQDDSEREEGELSEEGEIPSEYPHSQHEPGELLPERVRKRCLLSLLSCLQCPSDAFPQWGKAVRGRDEQATMAPTAASAGPQAGRLKQDAAQKPQAGIPSLRYITGKTYAVKEVLWTT